MDQQFSLRWNNYLNQITNAFDSLKNEEDLVDVTISCEGKKLKAHKMLLSACSPYFRNIFKDNPCQHPVIVFRNFKFVDLEAIIDFMYKGEVDVKQEHFESFLGTAELLEVKGLSDGSEKTNNMEEEDSDASKTFGSETDLLPDQPRSVSASSVNKHLASPAEVSRTSFSKKRKSNVCHSDKAKSDKKQKSRELDTPVLPKIEKSEFIEDLTFDEDDTDDSRSTSTEHSQVLSRHSRPNSSVDHSSLQNQQDYNLLPKVEKKLCCARKYAHKIARFTERDNRNRLRRKNCRSCWKKNGKEFKTTYYCKTCPDKPGLCLGECFDKYHDDN